MRSLLAEWIESEGHDVRAQCDGSAPTGWIPDLVIVDVATPRTGRCRRLAELQAAWPCVPMIAISSRFRPASSAFADAFGVRRVLAKPFRRDMLLRAVRESLDATLA